MLGKTVLGRCVLTAALCLLPGAASAEGPRLPIVPAPKQVSVQPGTVPLDGGWEVQMLGATPELAAVEGLLSDMRIAHAWSWRVTREGRSRHRIIVRSRPAFGAGIPLLEAQGYELSVEPDSIIIAAPTAVARDYGVQTLRQLLRASATLPRMKILDYPSLAWRGVSDDISRGQVSTLSDFRATLEHLSFYKINLYCLYIEDMARFWSVPEAGMDRGALTPSALRLITREAAGHHITVMPIFQTLGHQERLLALPALAPYSERPRPNPVVAWLRQAIWSCMPALAQAWGITDPSDPAPAVSCFSPTTPATRLRVAELVDEIAASAPSAFFHLGGDEPSDLGTGTSKKAVARQGRGAVYAGYVGALARHVTSDLDRQPVIFSDVLLEEPAAMAAIAKSTAIMDWHYDPADTGSSLRRLREAGFRTVFASPGLWNWFAIYPDYGRAFPNIHQMARAARRGNAAGLIVASWCDGGAESLRQGNWAGYAYAADLGWGAELDSADFFERFVPAEHGCASPALRRAEQLVGWQAFPTLGFNQRLFHLPARLTTHSDSWLERMTALERDMTEARTLIQRGSSQAEFGRDQVEILDHAAARFEYAAQRELTMDRLARRLGAEPWRSLSEADREDGVRAMASLRDSLEGLRQTYARLWLRGNRPTMLQPLIARLRRESALLENLLLEARRGELRAERVR
jgi:hypothetical protein